MQQTPQDAGNSHLGSPIGAIHYSTSPQECIYANIVKGGCSGYCGVDVDTQACLSR